MGKSDDDSSSSMRRRRRKERKRTKMEQKTTVKRKDERKKKRRRRDYSSSESDDESYYKERKRRKKESKKKRRKRRQRNDASDDDSGESSSLNRNFELAEAITSLLEERPALVEDLPILLIRLASGTAFDLSQMTDEYASRGIARVFSCLEPFGVRQNGRGSWVWQSPSNSNSNNELVLIGLVRAMFDQIGFTVSAIEEHENPDRTRDDRARKDQRMSTNPTTTETNNTLNVAKQTKVLLSQFQGQLAKELAGLCNMILEGESIALDGLPDERLRSALESLFVECALEKSEMEEDDREQDDNSKDETTAANFGYGLPQEKEEEVRSRLLTVLEICRSFVTSSVVKGPMPRPVTYSEPADYEESDSEDEGPLLPGAAKQKPAPSSAMIRARAARTSLELESARQGVQAPAPVGGREEWMLVPGKFDLLSALKSGQPVRSRTFEARSKSNGAASKKTVDPAIQSEIDAIRQAHDESRGPSLLDLHREKKAEDAMQAAGKKSSWKWDRDKDLDSGRKVDKNALNMLFGSAGNDLKSKFHGGL